MPRTVSFNSGSRLIAVKALSRIASSCAHHSPYQLQFSFYNQKALVFVFTILHCELAVRLRGVKFWAQRSEFESLNSRLKTTKSKLCCRRSSQIKLMSVWSENLAVASILSFYLFVLHVSFFLSTLPLYSDICAVFRSLEVMSHLWCLWTLAHSGGYENADCALFAIWPLKPLKQAEISRALSRHRSARCVCWLCEALKILHSMAKRSQCLVCAADLHLKAMKLHYKNLWERERERVSIRITRWSK